MFSPQRIRSKIYTHTHIRTHTRIHTLIKNTPIVPLPVCKDFQLHTHTHTEIHGIQGKIILPRRQTKGIFFFSSFLSQLVSNCPTLCFVWCRGKAVSAMTWRMRFYVSAKARCNSVSVRALDMALFRWPHSNGDVSHTQYIEKKKLFLPRLTQAKWRK